MIRVVDVIEPDRNVIGNFNKNECGVTKGGYLSNIVVHI